MTAWWAASSISAVFTTQWWVQTFEAFSQLLRGNGGWLPYVSEVCLCW
jgi:hypothetical protein